MCDIGESMSTEQEKLLYAKINLETAQISWKELERFFAGGLIITVHEHVDMVRVAQLMAADDVKAIAEMLDKKEIEKVTDDQARMWAESDALLWAVVVKPWILVQQRRS